MIRGVGKIASVEVDEFGGGLLYDRHFVFSDTSILFCWAEGILDNFNDFLLLIFCFLDKNGNTGTIDGASGVSVKNCVKLGNKIISDEGKHFMIFEDLIGLFSPC